MGSGRPLSLGIAEEATIIELAIITPLDKPTRNIGMASPDGELGAVVPDFHQQERGERRDSADNVMISIRYRFRRLLLTRFPIM